MFAVGDKVEIIEADDGAMHFFEEGCTGSIVKVDTSDEDMPYRVRCGTLEQWVSHNDIKGV